MSWGIKVAVVIPAYNEARMVGHVIQGVDKAFRKSDYEYQIIVVDDGSTDATASKVQKSIKNVHIIRHVLNTGSGGATATGLSYAQQKGFDIAVTLDADGQHSAKDVLRGVKILSNSDIDLLIGSRLMERKGMSKIKVFGNKGLSLITNILFGIKITDSQSGLRVFSKKALDSLKWKTAGYEFASEMLWRAKQQALTIDEFPIEAIYTEYSAAKGQSNWNAINIIKSLIQRRIVEMFE